MVLILVSSTTVIASNLQKIPQGITLQKFLFLQGFKEKDLNALDLRSFRLMANSLYRVSENPSQSFLEIKIYEPESDLCHRIWKKKDKSGFEKIRENFITRLIKAEGKIQGSVISSIQQHFQDPWVSQRFMDAFVFDVDLKNEIKKNSRFSLTVEKKYDHGEFIRFGEVLDAILEINAGETIGRHYTFLSNGGFFAGGESRYGSRPFYPPVSYIHVSSLFQKRRYHPVKRKYQPHLGVDFALEEGSSIIAPCKGQVIKMGLNRGSGYYIVLNHHNGFKTSYSHLKSIDKSIQIGALIKLGQKVGEVGCTGLCTKPHLHFAVKKGEKFVDPLKLILPLPLLKKDVTKNNDSLLFNINNLSLSPLFAWIKSL